MSYRVIYTKQFRDALDLQLDYFMAHGALPSRISAWLSDLFDLVDSLDEFPHRYPVAELESVICGIQLRKVVFGDYLAFYHVDDDNRIVQLLGFRHGARLP